MILAFRTDKPEADLYLYRPDGQLVAEHHWLADRQLADTLLPTIEDFLHANNIKVTQLTGLVIFTGSGSFTGLRIGTTVTNAMAFGLNIPVVKANGDNWQSVGRHALKSAQPAQPVTPDYGGEPNITRPKQSN